LDSRTPHIDTRPFQDDNCSDLLVMAISTSSELNEMKEALRRRVVAQKPSIHEPKPPNLINNQNKPKLMSMLTSTDMMKLLQISKRTLHSYRKNGTIEFIQIGGKFYYPNPFESKQT